MRIGKEEGEGWFESEMRRWKKEEWGGIWAEGTLCIKAGGRAFSTS